MSLGPAIEALNEMKQLGLIGEFAIIGSVALSFHVQPILTDDVDVAFLHDEPSNKLFSMEEIYTYFKEKSFPISGFTATIGGWKVQLLPAFEPIVQEALSVAPAYQVYGTTVKAVSPEYIIAMKLNAGRPKDFVHITHFLSNKSLDMNLFNSILKKYGLEERWSKFLGSQLWIKNP